MKSATLAIVVISLLIVIFNNIQQLVVFIDSWELLFWFIAEAVIITGYITYNKDMLKYITKR